MPPWITQERAEWAAIGIDFDRRDEIGFFLRANCRPANAVPAGGDRHHFFNPGNRCGIVFDYAEAYLQYTREGSELRIIYVEVPTSSRRQGRASRLYDEMFTLHGDLPTSTLGRSTDGKAFRQHFRQQRPRSELSTGAEQ